MIDAHQHFWDIKREDCRWPTSDLSAIYRSFSMSDYLHAVERAPMRGSVLVQSQACDSDTDYLLALSAEYKTILAVVGWVDLEAKNACERIHFLAKQNKMRGLRPMLQAITDADWINHRSVQPAIACMVREEMRFDALIQPRHLKALTEFAKKYPDLGIVVDHAAKPDIAAGDFIFWADGLKRLSECDNVYCKLSGLVTEAKQSQLSDFENFKPWIKHILDCFSDDRVLWGSDWPVVNLASSWQEWYTESCKLLNELKRDKAAQAKIFDANARRFYGL